MATPNVTDEEIQFRKRARRRLVGAVVLVLLVVVVVPWILPEDKPQQDTQPIEIRIPAQDASGYAPKVLPAPSPIVQQPGQAAQAAPVMPTPEPVLPAQPSAEKVAPEKEAQKDHGQAKPSAPAKVEVSQKKHTSEAPAKAAAAISVGESYFVQYGAFSEAKNARQRQAELKKKGIATYTEVVKTSSGDRIRVRSGPYVTHEAAEKVRQKAKPLDSKLVVIGGKG
jgi:DedD protein